MKLKVVNMININGTYVDYETLSKEQKLEIGTAINERALKILGFVRVIIKDKTDGKDD